MTSPAPSTQPKLDPPGKGLPFLEHWISRLLVEWKFRTTSRADAEMLFERERSKIVELAGSFDSTRASRPVLIDRLRGLEDSSRFWSIYMTVDHLRIVNEQITAVIRSLLAGTVPDRKASTAAVKPGSGADRSVIERFDAVCRELQRCVADAPDLRTKARYPHPWFGPFDAARWHFLAGVHMRLHRGQMKAIERGLEAD